MLLETPRLDSQASDPVDDDFINAMRQKLKESVPSQQIAAHEDLGGLTSTIKFA